ncbi:MAG: hypothetical protein ACPIOQ_15305, partial [Promethearchaeia archaeon]
MTSSEVIIKVDSASGVQNLGGLSAGTYIQLENEVMKVTSGANTNVNNEITVARGQLGSAARPHQDGTPITLVASTYTTLAMSTAPWDGQFGSTPVGALQTWVILQSPRRIELTVGSHFQMNSEIVKVTAIDGFNVSITRAQHNTEAAAHGAATLAIAFKSCRLDMGITGLSPGYLSFNDTLLRVDNPTVCGVAADAYVRVNRELILVTAAHSSLSRAFLISRGASSTMAATHVDGSTVTQVRMTVVQSDGGLDLSDTTVPLKSVAAIALAAEEYIQIDQEIMRVSAIVSNQSAAVVRAQAGSPAAEHTNGAAVTLVLSAVLAVDVSATHTVFQIADPYVIELAANKHYQIRDEIILVNSFGENGIVLIAITAGGTGYSDGAAATADCTGIANCLGSGFAGTCAVTAGAVTGISITSAGSGYVSAALPAIICAGGTGLVASTTLSTVTAATVARGQLSSSAAAHTTEHRIVAVERT